MGQGQGILGIVRRRKPDMADTDSAIEGLNEADVRRLLADPSVENRAETAAKIAHSFDAASLSPRERDLAEQIVRLMLNDAAVRVREALSHNLKTSSSLPHDVAMALARDVDSVALPMLESSVVLTDHDLIEIVRAANPAKQTAIAGRASVSPNVVSALIEGSGTAAISRLAANEGADLSEGAMQKILDRFGADETVQESLTRRERLPVTVSERMVAVVSDRMRDYLMARHEMSAATAADLLMESRERATVGLLPPGASGMDVVALARQMKDSGRLTPTLLLRALCMGDLTFFEAGIAALGDISLVAAHTLVYDEGPLGLQAAYRRARLPQALYPAFRVALDVARQTVFDGGENDRQRHMSRMIQRILTQFEDIGEENLDYLLRKLNQIGA
jgi:uncharacterized protein (DUF2336 family)